MYLTLRLLGSRRLDATLFTVLGVVRAAGVFWFVVPKTYGLGSLSILMVLGLVALSERQNVRIVWYLCASMASLSVTVTNWMVGIIAVGIQQSRSRALGILCTTFAIVSMLAVVQHRIFPMTRLFYALPIDETEHFLLPQSRGLGRWRDHFSGTQL